MFCFVCFVCFAIVIVVVLFCFSFFFSFFLYGFCFNRENLITRKINLFQRGGAAGGGADSARGKLWTLITFLILKQTLPNLATSSKIYLATIGYDISLPT